MARLFLGFDSSTQSLSAVVIDLDARKVVYEKSLNYDQALPQFKTRNGVLPNRDPLVKHSSPRLWVAALDGLFAQMKQDGVALDKILAVSGCGQQHGSVYLNDRAEAALANLNPQKSLEENLEGYQRLRVGKYRILYRYGEKDEILCVFMEARPTVYQLFAEARDLIDPL